MSFERESGFEALQSGNLEVAIEKLESACQQDECGHHDNFWWVHFLLLLTLRMIVF